MARCNRRALLERIVVLTTERKAYEHYVATHPFRDDDVSRMLCDQARTRWHQQDNREQRALWCLRRLALTLDERCGKGES